MKTLSRSLFLAVFCSGFLAALAAQTATTTPDIEAAQRGDQHASPPDQRKTGYESRGSEPGTEFYPPFFGYRLKITDSLIALFTAGLFVATLFLWLATRKLVTGADDTSRRQLRAYLGVERMKLSCAGFDDPNYRPPEVVAGYVHKDFIFVTIKNFGLTPAYDVKIWVNWFPTQYPERLPNAFPYPDLGVADPEAVGPTLSQHILHKDQSYTAIIAIKDLQPFITTRRQETMIYIYGHIDYRDVYGCRWVATFCQSWEPWSVTGVEFIPYQEHNDENEA